MSTTTHTAEPKIFDYGVTVSRSSPAQPHTPPQSPEHRLPSNGTNSHNNASTDIEAQSISSSCEQREGLPRPTGSENRAENTRQRHGDSPCLAESCSGLKQEGEGSNVSPVTDSGPRAHGLEPPARDNTAEDREYTIQLFIGGSGGPTSSSASAGRQQTDNTSSAQDGTKPQPCEVGASPATAVSQPSGVGSDGGGRVEIDTVSRLGESLGNRLTQLMKIPLFLLWCMLACSGAHKPVLHSHVLLSDSQHRINRVIWG